MRYLLCAVLALAACRRANTAREAQRADTTPPPPAAAPAPSQDTAAFAARLVGTWEAQGYDSGATANSSATGPSPEGGHRADRSNRESTASGCFRGQDSTVVESAPPQSHTQGRGGDALGSRRF
jgi:hypothetical protein